MTMHAIHIAGLGRRPRPRADRGGSRPGCARNSTEAGAARRATTAGTTPSGSGTGWWPRTPPLVVQPDLGRRRGVRPSRFAADHGLLLSIKGGGHNIAGTSIADGGLTLDMSRMREVDRGSRRPAGPRRRRCLLKDVDRATQEHGLAAVLGFVSETGVAGLTLGGGFGYLTRRFGWTVDNLDEVEIVTADGQVRTASRDENADLFWALRGGGGNFGVVTRFTFRLHEVGPMVTGGLIAWARAGRRGAGRLPDAHRVGAPRATAALIIRLAPPAPFVPERVARQAHRRHGRLPQRARTRRPTCAPSGPSATPSST